MTQAGVRRTYSLCLVKSDKLEELSSALGPRSGTLVGSMLCNCALHFSWDSKQSLSRAEAQSNAVLEEVSPDIVCLTETCFKSAWDSNKKSQHAVTRNPIPSVQNSKTIRIVY
jgi:hypothetical protein